jgi:hypothetical protein
MSFVLSFSKGHFELTGFFFLKKIFKMLKRNSTEEIS